APLLVRYGNDPSHDDAAPSAPVDKHATGPSAKPANFDRGDCHSSSDLGEKFDGVCGRVFSIPTCRFRPRRPHKKETPMSRYVDQRTYQTFEEFEREELRRDGYFESVEDLMDEMFAGELDFEGSGGKRASHDDEEE